MFVGCGEKNLGNFRGEFLFYMSDFTLNDVMKSNEIEGYCLRGQIVILLRM